MTFRAQRSNADDDVVWRVSGDIAADCVADLRALLEAEPDRRVVLDLSDVAVVEHAGVLFLAECVRRGVGLTNCPAYVREWMERERHMPGRNG